MNRPLRHGWGLERVNGPLLHGAKVGSALTPAAAVQAMLTGTVGYALDPTNTAKMWQDALRATPVALVNDPVRMFDSQWGLSTLTFEVAADADRALWTGTGLDFDGTSDFLRETADVLRNSAAGFVCMKVNPDTVSSISTYHQVSTNVSGASRLYLGHTATAELRLVSSRLDADGSTTILSAASAMAAGVAAVVSAAINYAGSGAMTIWKNGTQVATGTLGGTPSNTSDTATNRVNFANNASSGLLLNGKIGRFVYLPFIPTAGQRADVEAWVGEAAL